MAETATPRRGPGRRAILAWCLYDFANSPFTTLVLTFIYADFFVRVIVGNDVKGTPLWTSAINASAVLVAISTPVLGAIADRVRGGKKFLGASMAVCALATGLLALPYQGDAAAAWFLVLVAATSYEVANVFYNAFLPHLAAPERIGRVSGWGWSLGYLGGLLCFVPALGMVGRPADDGGYVCGPWVSPADHWGVRATNLLVAAWFVLFALPFFLWVPESGRETRSRAGGRWTDGFRQLADTFRSLRRYRQALRFLIAHMLYNDGLVTVFLLAGLYAGATIGMATHEIMLLGVWLNVVAGAGALAMGYLDDYLGGKRTILATLVLLIASTLMAMAATSTRQFWLAATVLGLMVGPNQSASRSLMGRFSPPGMEGEFFGFFAFSGKATAWLGVFAFGTITALVGSQRPAILAVTVLFAAGLVLMLFVDEAEGRRAASGEAQTS
jgi:UMF1 family MFS transporter